VKAVHGLWLPYAPRAQTRHLSQTMPCPKNPLTAGPASSKWSLSWSPCPGMESSKV
ncbi:unnamed protein product, partial [Bubo scandiacus]